MISTASLTAHDRCARSAFLGREWERNLVNPTAALYQAVEAGLECEGEDDPGQVAGDQLMTIATERGLDTAQADQYGQAVHLCSLADMLTWFLRPGEAWERPEDTEVGEVPWASSAFLDKSGTRLRRLVIVDRWSEERKRAESHSWRAIGEVVAYDLPMIQTVVVVGQHREGRRHSPWTKAWTHPVNHKLRMRKRSGESFGGQWRPVWREETEYPREKWLEAMTEDGILGDVAFEVEVSVPDEPGRTKIRALMERKLAEVRDTTELPPPCPSVCDWPVPCQFRDACWNFVLPSERGGFVRLDSNDGR